LRRSGSQQLSVEQAGKGLAAIAEDVDASGVGLADAIGRVRAELEQAIKDGDLAEELGGLAIEQAAAYIRQTRGTYADYMTALRSDPGPSTTPASPGPGVSPPGTP
jgi:hypothetical protein